VAEYRYTFRNSNKKSVVIMKLLTNPEYAHALIKRGLIADTECRGIPFADLCQVLCVAPTFLHEQLAEQGIGVANGRVMAAWKWDFTNT